MTALPAAIPVTGLGATGLSFTGPGDGPRTVEAVAALGEAALGRTGPA